MGSLAAFNAVLQALGAGAVFDDSGPFAADGVFWHAAFFSFVVWILLASIVAVRTGDFHRAPTAR